MGRTFEHERRRRRNRGRRRGGRHNDLAVGRVQSPGIANLRPGGIGIGATVDLARPEMTELHGVQGRLVEIGIAAAGGDLALLDRPVGADQEAQHHGALLFEAARLGRIGGSPTGLRRVDGRQGAQIGVRVSLQQDPRPKPAAANTLPPHARPLFPSLRADGRTIPPHAASRPHRFPEVSFAISAEAADRLVTSATAWVATRRLISLVDQRLLVSPPLTKTATPVSSTITPRQGPGPGED
jgi:hypothetical protein